MVVGWESAPCSDPDVGPKKKPPPVSTGGGKVGCTYSSRGARVTATTATTDTIIAIAEERTDLVTEGVMRKRQNGKGSNGRQALRRKGWGKLRREA